MLTAVPHRLVSAPWVVPIGAPPLREGALVLDADGGIVELGPRAALKATHGTLPETRGEGVVVPGLVNAHTHLELSALAGRVPGGSGVIAWTRALAAQLREGDAQGNARESRAAAEAAAIGARALGTVAIGDVGNGTIGWCALAAAGLQGLFFHELVGSREARTGDAIADAAAERAAVPASERPAQVSAVPAPHAPYSVGPALLERIFATAAAAGLPTSVHLAEDPDEVALLRDGSGGWPAVLRALGVSPEEQKQRISGLEPCAYLAAHGGFATTQPPLLVHMVHASAGDRRHARDAGATVVLCPRSNLHIGGRLPDVPALLGDGVALALGTDSLASAPDLSLWAELAALADAFPDVAPRTWLYAATAGGAQALRLAHLGALAPSKRPGLLDVIPASASLDPERALVSAPPLTLRWLVPA